MNTWKTWETPPTNCPFCGAKIDMATLTTVNDEKTMPEAGDITICFRCAGICVFGDELKLRRPTAEELDDFSFRMEVQKIVNGIRELRRLN